MFIHHFTAAHLTFLSKHVCTTDGDVASNPILECLTMLLLLFFFLIGLTCESEYFYLLNSR